MGFIQFPLFFYSSVTRKQRERCFCWCERHETVPL
ncbi:Uncharacterised protein [Vibrio cholerae]|nr:Uncharacterised protein [Vibrio cholerae]